MESESTATCATIKRRRSTRSPSGHVFVFRGKRGDLLKCLYWSDGGLCLLAKRLEKGRFAWPRADAGVVALTTAQLSLLLEGFDWRQPVEAARPRSAL
ncbi:IS66 family insertion sequence element accessory protein TnpB [Burkholderia gladioli]|uniref:IS66 family insertion sequence element accessory protein TnpB n=1 Tax=Burkholderia gladioli TaxID=28095 RepID=UPI00163F9F6D